MHPGLLQAYRGCLKAVYQIKRRDTFIFNSIVSVLQNRKSFPNQKQSMQLLQGLRGLINLALDSTNSPQKQRQITKIVRIFTNNSKYVTSDLKFAPGYSTLAIHKLKEDPQFQSLGDRDKQFVKKIVVKVCDRRPIMEFKTVADYLKNHNSEKFQIEASREADRQEDRKNTQTADERHQQLMQLGAKSEWKWAYQRLSESKKVKVQDIVQEIISRKIILF